MRALRIKAGLSQAAVASQMKAAGQGVDRGTVSRMERCVTRGRPDRLALMVSILSRNRGTDPAAALESDRARPTTELLSELAALKDLLRAVAYEKDAGGDPDALDRIGQGAVLRVGQIAATLLNRGPAAGGTQ